MDSPVQAKPDPVSTPRARAALTAIRTVESSGSATTGWDDAVLDAVRRSKQSHVVGFEVVRLAGELRRGRIATYRAVVKIAYAEELTGP